MGFRGTLDDAAAKLLRRMLTAISLGGASGLATIKVALVLAIVVGAG